jgi:hypothetical protein
MASAAVAVWSRLQREALREDSGKFRAALGRSGKINRRLEHNLRAIDRG